MKKSKALTVIVIVLGILIVFAICLLLYGVMVLHRSPQATFANSEITFKIPNNEHIITISSNHSCSSCVVIATGKTSIKHIFIVDVNTGIIRSSISCNK